MRLLGKVFQVMLGLGIVLIVLWCIELVLWSLVLTPLYLLYRVLFA